MSLDLGGQSIGGLLGRARRFSISETTSEGSSCPSYGTYIDTSYGIEYPYGETAVINEETYYSQISDVDVKADGVCGSFLDWENAYNIVYKPFDTFITTKVDNHTSGSLYISYLDATFPNKNVVGWEYRWDGIGGYFSIDWSVSNFAYGYEYGAISQTFEYPSSSGNFYPNGLNDSYISDGYGYFTSTVTGSYLPYNYLYEYYPVLIEVPSGSGAYFQNGFGSAILADGHGGAYDGMYGSYYPFGSVVYATTPNYTNVLDNAMFGTTTPFLNGTSTDLVSDGGGGYTTAIGGLFFSAGTYINYYDGKTEVPSGTANWYFNGAIIENYWDGFGGYYPSVQTGTSFYPYGQYINSTGWQINVPMPSGPYYDNSWYAWDGSGGYYIAYYPYGQYIAGNNSSTEVPSGSGYFLDNGYYAWDGGGSYFSKYYDYGEYIYNDGTYSYYWDGSGGYYQI